MNNEQTLIDLGFQPHPDWDFTDIGVKHFRLQKGDSTFRAFVCDCNPPVYVQIGQVINGAGIVSRWKDCVSPGSVERFVNK